MKDACASLTDRCGGAPGAQQVENWPTDLVVLDLSPTDGDNMFNCNQPFIISPSHRLVRLKNS